MIRVFVVDDSPFVRKALRRVLGADSGIQVVGEAATGEEALSLIPDADPHVVTLDVEMQGISGLDVLRQLLLWRPGLRVLMLSAHTRDGASATLEALAAGAADFIDKQNLNLMDLDRLGRELGDRLRALGGARDTHQPRVRPDGGARQGAGLPMPAATELARAEVCVIGASTGGPAALQALLEAVPSEFPVPIAIVQHMPPGFTRPFAARLDGLCRLTVAEAEDGVRLAPGMVVIAPAGMHLRLSPSLVTVLSADGGGARHVPSVDVLFRSVAKARPGRVLGVLLTGMGDDGAEGLSQIRAQGGITLAESEETCAVYGMPRAAVERGAAQFVLPLPQITRMLAAMPDGVAGGR
jgi:two-component system, chemotaxis family, protein-glutamate methylesterase/glutaminase